MKPIKKNILNMTQLSYQIDNLDQKLIAVTSKILAFEKRLQREYDVLWKQQKQVMDMLEKVGSND